MPVLELFPDNPDDRVLKKAAAALMDGEIIIAPTDTLYAFTCLLSNRDGIERICRLVGKKPEKANLSILCADLKHISDFTQQFSKSTYKLMNRNLPGPFTFILRANNRVPKLFLNNRKTIGIRVPDSKVALGLLAYCTEPLVCASVHDPELPGEFLTDPGDMDRHFGAQVKYILDAGTGGNRGSAVIDCSGEEPELIREGPREII